MRRVVFVLGFVCVLGCQKKLEINRYRWSAQTKNSRPKIQKDLFSDASTSLRVFDEVVERSTQKIGGALVESSYQQQIFDDQGHPLYLEAQFQNFDSANPSTLAEEADRLMKQRFEALEKVKESNSALQSANHIFEPQLVVQNTKDGVKFQFKIEYIPQDGSAVYSMRLNSNYEIESIKRVEHCFQESRSLVFPEGPRLSRLVEILLSPLLGDGFLTSPRFLVESDDGSRVTSENGNFMFGPEDPRFDHVQAFFYTQKTLTYAEDHWKLSLPFKLRVGLRAGYPQKTNTAYYYRGLIRLGDGDDVGYKMIPRDPSIVSHEVAHAIIDSLTGMGNEGEAASINEAFADYLTATLWDNPQLGHTAFLRRAYTRSVEVSTTFSEKNGGLYHDSGIVSGTFWDIQKRLGPEKGQLLALKTLIRLGAQPSFADIRPALEDAMKAAGFSDAEQAEVRSVMDSRGWPVLL